MKVSVIMSVYNNQDSVSEAIDSILGQTFDDFEFIIINDGSTDATEKAILRYQEKDNRIVIINQENKGLTRSLNIGIENAKGEYIARQDADDVSLPQRLKEQVDFLDKNKEIGFAGSSFEMIDEDGRFVDFVYIKNEPEKIKLRLKDRNIFCHGTIVFRCQLLNGVCGYRDFFRFSQDYDLYLRLIEQTYPGSVNNVLYRKRAALGSISIQKIHLQSAYAQLAKRCYESRLAQKDDSCLLNESYLKEIDNPLSYDIILPFMQSLYYVKKNNPKEARSVMKSYFFPFSVGKFKLYLLWFFSYFPAPIRDSLFTVKTNLRKIKLALK